MYNKYFYLVVLCFIILPQVNFASSRCSIDMTEPFIFTDNAIEISASTDSISVSAPDTLNYHVKNSPAGSINIMQKRTDFDSLRTIAPLKWYDMFTNIPGDAVRFYNQEFTVKRIPMYIGIAAVTAGLIITDDKTWKESDKFYRRNNFNKNLSDIFVETGDGSSQFVLAAAFSAYGFAAKDDRALRTASEIVEAVLTSGAVVQVLKHITGRESPYLSTRAGGAWRFFPNQVEYFKHVPAHDAYPSGHLTTSLAAFVVIADNYPEAKWISPVCYTTEALLAFSMVNQGIHWYSDYPLAVLLGYAFGKIAAHPGGPANGNSIISDLNIQPFIGNIYNGVSLTFNF